MAKNEFVVIGCKLPHGLYLDLLDKAGNLRERHKLQGCAGFTLPNPDRHFKNPETTNGSTLNIIPKDFWDEWYDKHKEHPALASGAIYMAAKKEDAVARSREVEKETTGFEKLDPKKEGITKLNDKDKPE